MLSPLLLSLVFSRSQDAPTAAGLISKMLARYAGAKSVAATIRTTQSASGVSVVTDTTLAYERPAKIRVNQTQVGGSTHRRGFLVSDGVSVTYRKPEYLVEAQRQRGERDGDNPYFFEPSKGVDGVSRRVEELYALVGSSIPDRSPLLDVLVGGVDNDTYFAGQLAQFSLAGKDEIDGKTVEVIAGRWREAPDRRASGDFKLYLTDEGEAMRYVLTQTFAAPASVIRNGKPTVGSEPITVTTVWDAKVAVNAPLKEGTFAMRE